MSRSLNRITLLGNVGNDPEIRSTQAGAKVATLSLATSRAWMDGRGDKQEKTEWHRLVAWTQPGKSGLADVIEKYVNKGDKLYVEGRVEYRQWQDKEGQTRYTTEVNVSSILLLGSRQEQPSNARHAETLSTAFSEHEDPDPAHDLLAAGEDDLPF